MRLNSWSDNTSTECERISRIEEAGEHSRKREQLEQIWEDTGRRTGAVSSEQVGREDG